MAVGACALAAGALAPVLSPARAATIHTYDAGAPVAGASAAGRASAARRRSSLRDASTHRSPSSRRSPSPPGASPPPGPAPPRAPSGPPLVGANGAGAGLTEGMLGGGDASSSAASSGGDPLVENGLGSPLCAPADAGALSVASQRNCASSGFEAAGAPTGDYALDVHIDTGALGFTAATLEQDYLIGPVWMGLVWIVHTLVVALEWSFTLDLLGGSAMDGVERSLRATQAAFTRPWLVLAFALASLAAAYNGLVRRRVAETLGQALLMLAMMAGGLWVIADPAGTVGALGRWADDASAGALGTVVEGTPARAPRTLADSMGGLFAGVVGAPWCYLEFGDVRWCSEPDRLDGRLRAAGLRIAAAAGGGCGATGGGAPEEVCQVLAGEQPRARAQSATLLRAARTNGQLFLALPANQAARNSINDRASLLSVLCGGNSDATDCRGPTASEAEYRTQGGTAPRLGGLLLIALGALGMLLLLGFVVLHLLGAELLGLLYLLLAPVAVIAPALGDGGRAAFRAWLARLVGVVTSKLLFSFLLGVVLLLTRTLLELYVFGWWTRWLLVSAMWWGAYLQRRRVLGFVEGELRAGGAGARSRGAAREGQDGAGGRDGRGALRREASIARLVQRQFETPLAAVRAAQWVRARRARPAPEVDRRAAHEPGAQRARSAVVGQAERTLAREREHAFEELAGAPRVEAELARKRTRLRRIESARTAASARGDRRRDATLAARARRIEQEIGHTQASLGRARLTAAAGERARRASGRLHTRPEVEERGRLLDAQAALPPRGVPATANGERRDYEALAGLAGYAPAQYRQLDPRHRREARMEIDRELARRRDPAARRIAGPVVQRTAHSPAQRTAAPAAPRTAAQRTAAPRAAAPCEPARAESAVMRDAREVARRRKRQLGG